MQKFIKFVVRHVPRTTMLRLGGVFGKMAGIMYSGNNVECSICGHTYSKFLPYGNQGRDNRLCPGCLSLERHRLLWLFLKEKTNFFSAPLSVLHIAPEQPFLKRFKALTNLKYTTADLESPLADVHMDIRSMPFANDSFDILLCNHVLEHIDQEQKALSEIKRVLKPNGWAILQVPIEYNREVTFEDNSITDRAERERLFGQYDHVRVYGCDYPQRLAQSGLNVDANEFVKSLDEKLAERYRLDKHEIIYRVIKK